MLQDNSTGILNNFSKTGINSHFYKKLLVFKRPLENSTYDSSDLVIPSGLGCLVTKDSVPL